MVFALLFCLLGTALTGWMIGLAAFWGKVGLRKYMD
ncbi:MAG: cytochrome b [Psychromonas sp.]|jgi:cytochrome b